MRVCIRPRGSRLRPALLPHLRDADHGLLDLLEGVDRDLLGVLLVVHGLHEVLIHGVAPAVPHALKLPHLQAAEEFSPAHGLDASNDEHDDLDDPVGQDEDAHLELGDRGLPLASENGVDGDLARELHVRVGIPQLFEPPPLLLLPLVFGRQEDNLQQLLLRGPELDVPLLRAVPQVPKAEHEQDAEVSGEVVDTGVLEGQRRCEELRPLHQFDGEDGAGADAGHAVAIRLHDVLLGVLPRRQTTQGRPTTDSVLISADPGQILPPRHAIGRECAVAPAAVSDCVGLQAERELDLSEVLVPAANVESLAARAQLHGVRQCDVGLGCDQGACRVQHGVDRPAHHHYDNPVEDALLLWGLVALRVHVPPAGGLRGRLPGPIHAHEAGLPEPRDLDPRVRPSHNILVVRQYRHAHGLDAVQPSHKD
mmetsp:Transcript_143741/g.460028  ORF Transcript_143741/g.460028 Transcript_143741/m.460028 type:complete len:423 (-) Transcript_143741:735-2003(-)